VGELDDAIEELQVQRSEDAVALARERAGRAHRDRSQRERLGSLVSEFLEKAESRGLPGIKRIKLRLGVYQVGGRRPRERRFSGWSFEYHDHYGLTALLVTREGLVYAETPLSHDVFEDAFVHPTDERSPVLRPEELREVASSMAAIILDDEA
jgi:hypothetical protein